MKIFWAIITVLFMFVGVDFSGRAVKAEQVWARAAVQGGTSTVYMIIKNGTSEGDSMFGASSSVAENAVISQVKNDNGIETVEELKSLPVEAGQTVTLKPHGIYLTLTGLHKALVIGDSIPITLNFTKAGLVETKAHVEATNATLYDNF